MKISYSWLNEYIELKETPEQISEILTGTGLEVEGLEQIEKIPGSLEGLVVGEVLDCLPHPNADKLKLTRVDIGNGEQRHIVCGAPNVAAGQKVVVAPVDTTIYPIGGLPFKIKKAKIRGEVSEGMICAEDEIGLGASHLGVIVLNTKAKNGTPAANLYDAGKDHIFEIGLTPNRGDAASHMGVARDLKAYFTRPLKSSKNPTFKINEDNPIQVSVEHLTACPRYSGYTIRGLKVTPSPDWLQHRLRSIGLDPINNIVDITNYVLHSLGQPLHAFDAREIIGNRIMVKMLPAGSQFTTLDEVERKLHPEDLMICDGKSNGMCIGGVFGGIKSGVKDNTTDIFLESAYFSQDFIRATANRHGLSTDASFRFERGTDPEMTVKALNFATRLILEIAGGYVASDLVDIYPEKIEPVRINTSFSTFHRLIGKHLPGDEIIEILQGLDIKSENIKNENFTAVVPPYRSEVTREADLVEEVLRIHGINNIDIDASFSTSYLAEFVKHEPYNVQENISHFLAGKGFFEIVTNSITNEKYAEELPLVDGDPITLLNKSSEDLGILKPTPVYNALESIRHNINRKRGNLKFFEFTKSYIRRDGRYLEFPKLCLLMTGKEHDESWMKAPFEITFQHINEVVKDTFTKCGIGDLRNSPLPESQIFAYGLRIKSGKKTLGKVGRLLSPITRYFNISQSVFYAELEWEEILTSFSDNLLYQPLSKFPEVRRDLSLVIDREISYREIEEISFNSEKKLLNRMNVFSVYEGDRIDRGKKAYAIAFYLQDNSRTLKDKDIDKSMRQLMSAFETKINAVIRK